MNQTLPRPQSNLSQNARLCKKIQINHTRNKKQDHTMLWTKQRSHLTMLPPKMRIGTRKSSLFFMGRRCGMKATIRNVYG